MNPIIAERGVDLRVPAAVPGRLPQSPGLRGSCDPGSDAPCGELSTAKDPKRIGDGPDARGACDDAPYPVGLSLPPLTVAPMTIPALIRIRFLMMY
jgi:hypothetical protein